MAEGELASASGGTTTDDVGNSAVAGGTKSVQSTATKVRTQGAFEP